MSLNVRWPSSTNKGTALLKLLHQRLPSPLVKDEYLRWFVDDTGSSHDLSTKSLATPARSPPEEFQRVAFWYVALREKFFDNLVEGSIRSGSKQLLLLGSGFDTRFLRLKCLSDTSVQTFEVDIERTISEKRRTLIRRLGRVPPNLHLLPIDLNKGNLLDLFEKGMSRHSATVCILQGVSYYLAEDAVQRVLKFMSRSLPQRSTIGFDCCSPLMLIENDRVPGIRFNIRELQTKAEPYVFGMESRRMRHWLGELGLAGIRIIDQQELEKMYRPGIHLPKRMWYCVSAKTAREPAL